MKHIELIALAFAASLLLTLACGGGAEPDPTPGPDPVDPVETITPQYYFTKTFVGLMGSESETVELRDHCQKYDLAKNPEGVSFVSADQSVVSVDASGKISAVGVGHTKVTATDKNGNSASIYARVYPKDYVRYVNPVANKFPILAWIGDVNTRAAYEDMCAAGFNMLYPGWKSAEDTETMFQLVSGLDLKICLLTPLSWAEQVSKYGKNPNLGMYFITDEPTRIDDEIRDAIKFFNANDPAHAPYINFKPGGFESDFERFPIRFYSYDHYIIMSTGMKPTHFPNLVEMMDCSAKMAVPMWCFTNSVKHWDYLYPTIDHIRFQLYSDLMFGCQGYQYFTYTVPTEEDYIIALLDRSGNKTDIWKAAKTVNAELQVYSKYLLDSYCVEMMGNADASLVQYDPERLPYPLSGVSSVNKFIVSHFCRGEEEYIAVFNASYTEYSNFVLNFKTGVTRINADGTSYAVEKGIYTTSVDPGAIALFRIR